MWTIAVRKECDVLVCGGGSAGAITAIAAARNGARTVLLEKEGFCGGICVGSLVHSLDGIRNCRNYEQFVIGGIGVELVHRLEVTGGMATHDNPPEGVEFNPEAFKLIADDMLEEAGVEVLYHLFAAAVVRESAEVSAVIAAGKEGIWEIRAKQVVDATGDGDVAAFAGAEFEKHAEMQAMSMHFRIGGVTPGIPWNEIEKECRIAVDAAYAAGRSPKYGGPWIIRIRDGEVTANCTRLYGDGVNTADLSKAEREGRRDMMKIIQILRDSAPLFQDAYLLAAASQIGVRETRRILGDYQITGGDILACRRFDDVVAMGSWPIDIHPADGRVGVHPHKENPPEPYQIPLGCLLVRGFDNLLVAGRCMSSTHEAHGSTRVSGTAMALGQAAGTVAAMACENGGTPRKVSVQSLQDRLRRQGAILCL
jgi:hypothetical protein